jgi:hypothetical protein
VEERWAVEERSRHQNLLALGHELADTAGSAVEVGEVALDGTIGCEEHEGHPGDPFAGGDSHRHGVGGALVPVRLCPAVQVLGAGGTGRSCSR